MTASVYTGYKFEDIIIQGFGYSAVNINNVDATENGYSLILDNFEARWIVQSVGGMAINIPSAVHITNGCRFVNNMMGPYGGNCYGQSYLVADSADTQSLFEDSEFIRFGRNGAFRGSAPVARRCFFMDLLVQTGLVSSVQQHPFTFEAGASPVIYRCIFYNMGHDNMYDNNINPDTFTAYNNTYLDDRRCDWIAMQNSYDTDWKVVAKNNCYICRMPIVYGYGSSDLDYANSDSNYNFIGSNDGDHVWSTDDGYKDTLAEWQAYTNSQGTQLDTNSIWDADARDNLLDIFDSVTYGDADFLMPKFGGPLIDVGDTVTTGENGIDFDGDTVVGLFDIGAYEYNGVDVTAPTYSSGSIGPLGTTFTLIASENITDGGLDGGEFDLDCTTAGNDVTLTYSSGDGTDTWLFTIGTTILQNETCNCDFDGDPDEVEDDSGNDMADFSNQAVTNYSGVGAGSSVASLATSETGTNVIGGNAGTLSFSN